MKWFVSIVLLTLWLPVLKAQDTLNLLFIGDVMAHQKQLDAARMGMAYSFDTCFAYIKPYLSEADIAIANLEVTLAGAPYSGYPTFSAPDELATALKKSGVDILLTANNHTCDKGKTGVERTIKILDSLDIVHTGTFYDSAHRAQTYPLLLQKNNISVALLNYTYGTNDIPTPSPTIVNRIDTVQIAIDIARAKTLSPDVIAVAIHWGEEYKLYANQVQRNAAAFLLRQGVQLVIGSHPHVLQGMELYTSDDSTVRHAVVYSLGNFISNMTAANTEIGAMARIRVVKNNEKTVIEKGEYMFTWTYKPVKNNIRHFYVLPAAVYANDSTFFADDKAYARMINSLDHMRTLYKETTIGFTEYTE
jgi:poly-gamma-glutamate synthesis protein (capsule biosynthesis protein)